MYTSHSRRMPVILMPPSQTASEIFSHKPHTEVFFPLHHHTKFPVHTESLRRCLAKPVLRTSPSSQPGMCSSVQIPYSKLSSFPSHTAIPPTVSNTSALGGMLFLSLIYIFTDKITRFQKRKNFRLSIIKFSFVYRHTTSVNVRNLDILTFSKNLTENSIFFDIPKTLRRLLLDTHFGYPSQNTSS